MKKFTVLALLCAFALGSCQVISFPTNPAPNVDSQGTVNALIQTANAQTLTAQPSPTTVPPTFTFTPVLAEASPTATSVPLFSDTPVINLTTTLATATPLTTASGPTATGLFATSTATLAAGQATASPTLGIRTYGTLPPLNRPFTQATIINRSKAEAYISLQIETDQGFTIIEYPVVKMVRIKIPTGNYTYVVWVGGRQFVGYFHASQIDEPVITIFKDKIVIK
jgi:hypothetical protein